MDELENEFDKMKIKSDADEEHQEGEESGQEKISQRKLRYLKMKDKKEEKKRKKQGTKASNNKNIIDNSSQIKNNDIKDEHKNGENSQDDENTNDASNNLKENNGEVGNPLGESHLKMKGKKYEPCIVEYCKVCGMPYEYCEYGNSFNQCKEENKEKYNYDILKNNTETTNKRQTKKPLQNTTQKITIQKTTRARKKVVTVIVGLHTYVKLDKMAKIFSRFYACGASVIKGSSNNAPDQIDIQGDVEHNIVDIIMKNCPEIPEDVFVILPPK
ncbi:translation initiation factor SUI1 [Plasmodium gonderi]|uniref:Translation initiation factor SUI1 n=1 Tax=Plasmodium gonderi TaxID=77519 RepID=A0A1Y1JRJ5_PLAGO|nr:translation initiation factor SUI1 [Plasmodium gonderi]GAW83462.1 translation initiation factor SUI1 [Plasmodium gonderi]